ncbi:YjjG family noncanonical pyrimidine nucleotidase [Alkalihalobacillus oceani]|uniref:YjjG family noncanonical pyrimidine nucleotidase n=1 Tax=Halalkalibacter oceani TaxID=1653776 RepID=UPI002040CB0F|nr:YjjG family noncanonical pyrimidine nucleotidase [Halalkalibacter oceani]MCM3760210.1 YjjG family noncanonical pyrimidine nucleotidase [Halalkalibacter oceani]
MKNYDIIFFDIDDTLFDFAKSEQVAFYKVFNHYNLVTGLNLYKKSYQEISKVLWRDLEDGKMGLVELGSERFRRLFLEHELEIDAVVFNQDYLKFLGEQTHLVQGAKQVIKALSHKRLAVITNGYTIVQTSRINGSPFKDIFEHIIISESTGFQKPQTGIFDYAFHKLQITDKSNALMVGDSLTSDIQGGMNYGMDTCWFNPAYKENPTSLKPTYEINKLKGLLEIVK